jgi:hypothetical protein
MILTLLCLCASAAPLRPNILIIFTDDQGYADLACSGNTKNKTPHMDQLAKEGTRLRPSIHKPSVVHRDRRC